MGLTKVIYEEWLIVPLTQDKWTLLLLRFICWALGGYGGGGLTWPQVCIVRSPGSSCPFKSFQVMGPCVVLPMKLSLTLYPFFSPSFAPSHSESRNLGFSCWHSVHTLASKGPSCHLEGPKNSRKEHVGSSEGAAGLPRASGHSRNALTAAPWRESRCARADEAGASPPRWRRSPQQPTGSRARTTRFGRRAGRACRHSRAAAGLFGGQHFNPWAGAAGSPHGSPRDPDRDPGPRGPGLTELRARSVCVHTRACVGQEPARDLGPAPCSCWSGPGCRGGGRGAGLYRLGNAGSSEPTS